MRRISIILISLLLSLFLLTSCTNSKLKSLYKSEEYEEVLVLASEILDEKITEPALYYACASNYRLNNLKEATRLSELYYYLFDDKDHRKTILRLMLFNSEPELAYQAALELTSTTVLSKTDNIQYYKVLNDNELYTAASKHLSDLMNQLTPGEAAFAVINGNAPTWQIISSLDNLYAKEGVSKDFVSAIKLALPIVAKSDGLDYIPILLKDTYDGSADYSIVLGDFYYSVGEDELAIKYWNNAAPIYPKVIQEREKLILR